MHKAIQETINVLQQEVDDRLRLIEGLKSMGEISSKRGPRGTYKPRAVAKKAKKTEPANASRKWTAARLKKFKSTLARKKAAIKEKGSE